MAVYLDTNALVQRDGLGSVELSTTIALCRELDVTIALPELVADEVESHRIRVVEAAFYSLVAAHREAARYAPIGALPESPNPGELGREYRRELGKDFVVLPTPSGAPAEALRREVFRLRPARDGGGARDVAIWLTVRDDHFTRSEPGYFVSNNTRDFSDSGDPDRFHETLADELKTHTSPLRLCRTHADLVRHLATPISAPIDEVSISNLLSFQQACVRLVHDADFVGRLKPPDDLAIREGSKLFPGSEVSVTLKRVQQFDGYTIEGRWVGVGRLHWDLSFELGALEKGAFGWVQRLAPIRCSVTGIVWFRESAEGGEPQAEIAHVATTSVSLA